MNEFELRESREQQKYILCLEKRVASLQKECDEYEKRRIEAQESGQEYREVGISLGVELESLLARNIAIGKESKKMEEGMEKDIVALTGDGNRMREALTLIARSSDLGWSVGRSAEELSELVRDEAEKGLGFSVEGRSDE